MFSLPGIHTTSLHADSIPENLRQNGWFIGAQAYTFKEFSAFEAIGKTKEAGGNMIEFYPGQILKPGSKEFDIKIAFHEHGGSMEKPKYKVWNPLYILGVVESRDKRVGACADLGHWCTSNLKPIDCLRILEGRVVSVHLKDKEKFGPSPVVVAGKGVVDVAACLEDRTHDSTSIHLQGGASLNPPKGGVFSIATLVQDN